MSYPPASLAAIAASAKTDPVFRHQLAVIVAESLAPPAGAAARLEDDLPPVTPQTRDAWQQAHDKAKQRRAAAA